jgi:FlaA1/EpsC-like NDP-sugar epimerase
MFHRFLVNFALLSMLIDAVLVCITLVIATWIRPPLSSIPYTAHYPEFIPTPWLIYPILAIEWVAIFLLFSVYDGRCNFRVVDELTSLTLASILASVASAGTLFLTYRDVSRFIFVIFALMTYVLLIAWRLISRGIFQTKQNRFSDQRRVLIIGAGQTGENLQKQIQVNSHLGWILRV